MFIEYGLVNIVTIRKSLSVVLLTCIGLCSSCHASEKLTSLGELDKFFQDAAASAFKELSTRPEFTSGIQDLGLLTEKVNKASKNQHPEQALGLINNNIGLIEANYKNKALLNLVSISLQNNSLGTAQKICNAINSSGAVTSAECFYEIANYVANQNAWDQVLGLLKAIDLNSDLSAEHSDKAFILWGAALQHLKKHRQSLEYYQHVKPESSAYPLAQLNIALVYIRQDWWTDAQIAMQNAIKANTEDDIEFTNRVYTTLGFSQLQQGFYRNARESFRKVKLNSSYADQALLGLGTAALNQEDFLGAFNAFDQLKKHTQKSIFQDQAYLLSAFSLAKLKQNKSAADAYSAAATYYEQEIDKLSKLRAQLDKNDIDGQTFSSTLATHNIHTTPETTALIGQMRILNSLLAYQLSERATSAIKTSYATIWNAYKLSTTENIDQRLAVLTTYLNQSHFGLTKLYDTP